MRAQVVIDHVKKAVRVQRHTGGEILVIPFEFIEAGIGADMTSDSDLLNITLLDIEFSSIEVIR